MEILVVSNIGFGPPLQGNRARMMNLIKQLEKHGKITFVGLDLDIAEFKKLEKNQTVVSVNLVRTNHFIRWLKFLKTKFNFQSGIKLKKQRFQLDQFEEKNLRKFGDSLKRLSTNKKWDIIIVPYSVNSWIFQLFNETNIYKIIDTHDAISNRIKNENDNFYSLDKKQESKLLSKADEIWAIQDYEMQYFKKILHNYEPQKIIKTIGMDYPTVKTIREDLDDITVGYIGSDNYNNVEGLRAFLQDLRCSGIKINLIIGGSIIKEIKDYSELYKKVDIVEVKDFYEKCDIVINPIKAGSGLKIKTIEALQHGKSVIGFKEAFSGLEHIKNEACKEVVSNQELIEKLIKFKKQDLSLFEQKAWEICETISNQARKNINETFEQLTTR